MAARSLVNALLLLQRPGLRPWDASAKGRTLAFVQGPRISWLSGSHMRAPIDFAIGLAAARRQWGSLFPVRRGLAPPTPRRRLSLSP